MSHLVLVSSPAFVCAFAGYQKQTSDDGSKSSCEQCLVGKYGADGLKCLLCPKGFYNDQVAQQECKVCDAAAGGDDICAVLPGATSQAEGGDTLSEEYMFMANINSSLIDAVNVTNLYDGEKNKIGEKDEKMKVSTKYAWYFSLSIPPMSIVILHRYLPLCFKNLDILFAGSNFIDDTVS